MIHEHDAPPHPDEVFNAARRITEPSARSAYLDQACGGNSALRQQVEALLAAFEQAGSFLQEPAAQIADIGGDTILRVTSEQPSLAREGAGTTIGHYRLLESIGEGGYGTVFMAEQTAPVRRRVALKVIKAGMDTRQVIARFEAERQALALMDHPNIARVFDAGVTESGRPYFVMELVKGMPITKYCDEHRLTPRDRLELFVQVCQAVQHAHQKGIIHRDLKPNNVLVAQYDGNPVPKVIDFGVAKATGQRLSEATMFTGFGDVIGTPEYMSPEQAELNQLDIDTRSDVYSLGVLLYELLTGTTPIEHKRVKEAALLEVLRLIREEEPPKPSTRLTRVEQLPTIAGQRNLEAKKLTGMLKGELDWIVMKALEKNRSRRYETASGLAADVQHYLRNEPVHACPRSKWYSFRKFVARNKRVVSTAAVLALSVLVAVVTLAVSNYMIRQEKERAKAAQLLAEGRAEEIRQGLVRLKTANALLDRGRWCATERRWDDAHAAFAKAIELRPDHLSVWMARGDLYTALGLWDLAAADYARQIERGEPDTTLRWFQYALLCLHVGDTDAYRLACGRMRERFHRTLNNVFAEELVRSNLLAPDPSVDPARLVEMAQKLADSQPWTGQYVLGVAHYRSGQYDQAIRQLQEARVGQPPLPIRLLCHPVLAMAYHRLGRSAEAHQALGEAAKVLDQWTGQHYAGPEGVWLDPPWWDYLECQLLYREAKLLIEGSLPPDDARLHVLRARALAGLGWAESKAAAEYHAALQLSPNDPQIRLEAHRNQGYCFAHHGEWEKAADQFAKACELKPEDSNLWRFRAVASFASGNLAAYQQVCAAILERFEATEDRRTAGNVLLACLLRDEALPDMTRLLPLSRVAAPIFHWGTWVRGSALYRAGRYAQSVQCFEEAAQTYSPRAWDWCFLAMGHHRLGHHRDARRCLAEAARWIEEADREEMDDVTGIRPAWGDWHEKVVYPILLREAKALIEDESGTRHSESKDRK
jgi:serine/threonine protein kinase/tetratricopeptide (TPR) repeat protein